MSTEKFVVKTLTGKTKADDFYLFTATNTDSSEIIEMSLKYNGRGIYRLLVLSYDQAQVLEALYGGYIQEYIG